MVVDCIVDSVVVDSVVVDSVIVDLVVVDSVVVDSVVVEEGKRERSGSRFIKEFVVIVFVRVYVSCWTDTRVVRSELSQTKEGGEVDKGFIQPESKDNPFYCLIPTKIKLRNLHTCLIPYTEQSCVVSVTLPIRPMNITLSPHAWRPSLLIGILVPPPNLHVPGYPLVVSDAVLIVYHALVCFEHAAEYHSGHLYVAGLC